MQQQTTQTQKTATFDDQGNTIEETEIVQEENAAEPLGSQPEPGSEDGNGKELAQGSPGKYRIGDKTFATQDEALEYAQSQVSALTTEQQIADAYRQGMREALSQPTQTAENVIPQTPAQPELNTEELYTNPQAFLDKFSRKIKTEAQAELDQRNAVQRESDQIWREFTERHPALADFRTEVENFVAGQTTEVRAIIATKGRPAGYDWVATKLKSRFEAYANAVKPKRELPNGSGGVTQSTKSGDVTPKTPAKKPLSFSEQIRSIRKRR